MPALSDARPLLPVPILAPREASGTPASCPVACGPHAGRARAAIPAPPPLSIWEGPLM